MSEHRGHEGRMALSQDWMYRAVDSLEAFSHVSLLEINRRSSAAVNNGLWTAALLFEAMVKSLLLLGVSQSVVQALGHLRNGALGHAIAGCLQQPGAFL